MVLARKVLITPLAAVNFNSDYFNITKVAKIGWESMKGCWTNIETNL